MAKLLLLLGLAALACRYLTGNWPWHYWSTVPGPARAARTLLGVSAAAGRDEIVEAHRRLVFRIHPDRGGSAAAVVEANEARDLLLARVSKE